MPGDSVGILIFTITVSSVGLVFSIYKLNQYKRLNYPAILIHLLVFSLSLFLFSIALTDTGFYLHAPHLWRLFSGLAYLNAPLCFLFIRVILTNRQAFKRTDLWVAVPFLMHFINMLPFVLSGRENKLDIIRSVMSDGNLFILEIEGFLLPGLNSWLRALVGLIMMIGQVLMMSGALHHFTQGDGRFEKADRRLYRWLWGLTGSLALTILLVLFQFAFNIFPAWDVLEVTMVTISLSLIFIIISLPLVSGLTRGFKHPLAHSDLFF